MGGRAWKAAVHGVAEGQTRLSDFTFTFYFHALEKEMATHSRVLAWRIPGTGEPGGLLSMGSHRVGHNWSDLAAVAAHASKVMLKWFKSIAVCFCQGHTPGWALGCKCQGFWKSPNYMFRSTFGKCISKVYFSLQIQIMKYFNCTHFQLTYHLNSE